MSVVRKIRLWEIDQWRSTLMPHVSTDKRFDSCENLTHLRVCNTDRGFSVFHLEHDQEERNTSSASIEGWESEENCVEKGVGSANEGGHQDAPQPSSGTFSETVEH